MTISKIPVVKPSSLPNDVKDREILVVEPGLASDHPAANPKAGGPNLSFIVSFMTFLAIVGGVAAGWVYRETWWPKVATMIGLEGKAPVKPPKPPVPVVTAVVQKKDMDVFLNGLGTVTAFKTVTIRSRVEGELVKVAFTEGQMVREGDQLAEIDRRPFDVQLQQAEGQLARDEATLTSAEFTLKRYQDLMLTKSIAPQQVDEQRSLVQQMNGAIQSDRGTIANAKLQLDYCHINAPISGRIGLRLVDQGNIVRANDPLGLAVITQLQPISLVFTIPQDDISRVQKAAADGHDLSVLAYDRDLKIKLASGKLLAIDNQVDATTGTVRIKAIFDNDDSLLFPNQFVNARLLVDKKDGATVVPTAAIQRGPVNYFVYVVRDDETVELRTVTPGLSEGAETSVNSGLSPGEIVVTDGLDKLQDKAKIQTKDSEKEKKPGAGGPKSDSGEKSTGTGEKKKGDGSKKPDGEKPKGGNPDDVKPGSENKKSVPSDKSAKDPAKSVSQFEKKSAQ